MEKTQFLEQYLFADCTNVTKQSDQENAPQFNETDFQVILDRSKDFGVGIYTIDTFFKDKPYESTNHEAHRKKATDYRWFQKAFATLKRKQAGLTYTATFKVSPKTLLKDIFTDEEE